MAKAKFMNGEFSAKFKGKRSHGQELPMMRRRELVFQRERDGIL